ncbi:hypothetical protein K502DRAFT_326197 [Neoconidiobolus thromboides FSU 785]|nr:hypothetical protein K502DRAFT_326197 [Neoconidiobolus thromboides FSU 785]
MMEIKSFFKKVTDSLTRKKSKKKSTVALSINTSVTEDISSDFIDIQTDSFKLNKNQSTSPRIPTFYECPTLSSDKSIKFLLKKENNGNSSEYLSTYNNETTDYFNYTPNTTLKNNSYHQGPYNYSALTFSTSPNDSVYSQLFENENENQNENQKNLSIYSLTEDNTSNWNYLKQESMNSNMTLVQKEIENQTKLRRGYHRNVSFVNKIKSQHIQQTSYNSSTDYMKSKAFTTHSKTTEHLPIANDIRQQDLGLMEAGQTIYELAKLISTKNSLDFPDTKLQPSFKRNSQAVTIQEPLLPPFQKVELVRQVNSYAFI